MGKLYLKDFSIEITRRCNMVCAHCLRGDAEALDIDHRHIRNVLRHIRHIQHFNITGGEPSLNVKAIRYILTQLRSFGITVNHFDLTTNGSLSSMSPEFIGVCAQLYDYQEEDQSYGGQMLDMSDDRFHDATHRNEVIEAYSSYPFFGPRGQSEDMFLIREGRSAEGYPNPVHPIYLTGSDYVYGDVYLNAQGMILGNGNLSYLRQRDHVLCSSGNFLKYLKTTERLNEPFTQKL